MSLPYERRNFPAPEAGPSTRASFKEVRSSRRREEAPVAAPGYTDIPQWQLKRLKDTFNTFDTNASGAIDLDEFIFAFRKLKVDMSHEEAEALFNSADTNGDGTIDFDEYMSLATGKLQEKHQEDELQELYNLLCDKRTKKVTLRTLRRAAHDWGVGFTDEEIDQMFMAGDTSGNGTIDRAEFEEIVRQCGFAVQTVP